MEETIGCCSVDDAATSLTEMMSLKRKEQNVEDTPKVLSLGGQVPSISSSLPICTSPTAHIKVYSYYEIDRSRLPSKCPDQLNSVRVVMVTEKSKSKVAMRFPSFHSLRLHLSERNGRKPDGKTLPSLDEKHMMEPTVAAEVLYRRITSDEIGKNRNSWSFWAASSLNVDYEVVSKKGSCWSELKRSDMMTWGKRKRLHQFANEEGSPRSYVKIQNNETEKVQEEEEEEQEDEEEMESHESNEELKQKRMKKNDVPIRVKSEKRNHVHRHGKKKKAIKNSISRWSRERYKSAEINMLRIMKEKRAVHVNPILRPALRAEARKHIGDTGLLDHLLKHMAGKVAPRGQERFMRKHNSDGAMEYWLESADLVNIRIKAGVEDPYWTPPPGWKPGDSPTQDPVCAREFRQLKEEIAKIRREMEEIVAKRHEDEMAIVPTPSSCVTTHNLEHDSFVRPLREMYTDLIIKKAKLEEQLMEISQSLSDMEQEMEKLKSTELNMALAVPMAETEDKAAKIERPKSSFRICKPQGTFLCPNMALLSPQPQTLQQQQQAGFIFNNYKQDVVPTPPSVSSSTATSQPLLLHHLPQHGSHHHHSAFSPVKPVSERRLPVTVALASPHSPLPLENTSAADATAQYVKEDTHAVGVKMTSLINLNEVPNSNDLSDVSPSQLTEQRRNNNVAATAGVPRREEDKMNQLVKEDTTRKEILRKYEQQQQLRQWECSSSSASSSSSSSSSSFSVGVATWLALTAPNAPPDSNPRRDFK